MANALLQKWIEHAERRALFWWQPKNAGVNMGDHLSKVIVSCVLSLQDKTLIEKRDLSKKLIAIGSVLHFAKDGDTVWGSGINGKIPAERNTFSTLDVRAVRGPKTRK
ncbi:polysaccharide pyruvyl transferase family protein, partial [Xanthomonas hortorum pv. pelargonii]|nr:polysaccharide pyruvyl transferase family protein [Xanthomonas hortorum pv. pelargonii]